MLTSKCAKTAKSLTEFAFEAAMSQDPKVSANALMEMGHAETKLAERSGELIRASFRAD